MPDRPKYIPIGYEEPTAPGVAPTPTPSDVSRGWKAAALATRLLGGVGSGIVGAVPSPITTPLAAAIGGGGEALAEHLESPAGTPLSKSRIATEAALSAVPLGKVYEAGKMGLSVARGAGLAELGNVARRKAETGKYLPQDKSEALKDLASVGLGGAFGLIPMKAHVPAPTPEASQIPATLPGVVETAIKNPSDLTPRVGQKYASLRVRTGDIEIPKVTETLSNVRAKTVGANPPVNQLDEGIAQANEVAKANRSVNETARKAENQLLKKEQTADLQDLKMTKGGTTLPAIEASQAKTNAAQLAQDELDRIKANLPIRQDPTSLSTPLSGVDPETGLPLRGSIRHVAEPTEEEALGSAIPPTSQVFAKKDEAASLINKLGGHEKFDIQKTPGGLFKVVEVKPPTGPTVKVGALDVPVKELNLDTTEAAPPAPAPPPEGQSPTAALEALTPEPDFMEPKVPEPAPKVRKIRVKAAVDTVPIIPNASAIPELAPTTPKIASLPEPGKSIIDLTPQKPKITPRAEKIAFAKVNFSPEANSQLDTLAKAYDAESDPVAKRGLGAQMAEVDRMERARLKAARQSGGGQAGFIDPILASRVGLGLGGAAVGAAVDKDDPLTGALMGGAAGAAAPSAFPFIQKGLEGLDPKLIYERLPNLQRAALLSGAGSILPNMTAAPIGLTTTTAGEKLLQGLVESLQGKGGATAQQGLDLLKQLPTLPRRGYRALQEAGNVLTNNAMNIAEEQSPWQRAKTPFDQVVAAPATGITAMHMGVRDAGTAANLPIAEAQTMALGNEPNKAYGPGGFVEDEIRRWGQALQGLKTSKEGKPSTIANMLAPFTRTATNVLAATPTRTPGIGLLIKMAGGTNEEWAPIIAQQGMGTAVGLASYQLGKNVTPETAKSIRKWVRNFGGRYGVVALMAFEAGQAAQAGASGGEKVSTALSTGLEGLPMPTTEAGKDWLGVAKDLAVNQKLTVPRSMIPFGLAPDKDSTYRDIIAKPIKSYKPKGY